jgi:hypothetical protein
VKSIQFLRNAPKVNEEQLSRVLELLRQAEQVLKDSLNN